MPPKARTLTVGCFPQAFPDRFPSERSTDYNVKTTFINDIMLQDMDYVSFQDGYFYKIYDQVSFIKATGNAHEKGMTDP